VIYNCCSDNRRTTILASPGAILAVPTILAPGTGYAVADVLSIQQPGSSLSATVTVTTVSTTGGVTALTLSANGTSYSTATGVPTTGGKGTGCTLNLLSTPNGIDYLEVLDAGVIAPAIPAHSLLLLHCLRPVPAKLTFRNVLITGGESITGITVAWIAPASAPPSGLPAALTSYLALLPNANSVLVAQPSTIGDLSPYTLSLVRDITSAENDTFAVTEVLAGFDPQLAQVQFTFRVDCGPNFDCAPQPPNCPPPASQPPAINYLAKDYGSFSTIMLDRLNQLLPGRMGSGEPDLGVALAEVIAYMGDLLSYRQDAIASEAYLNTAQSRVSLRRHAVLVDYPVHDGANARVWMQLEVAGNNGTPVFLDRTQTRFYTYAPGMPPTLAFGSGNENAALLSGVQVFEPLEDAQLYPEHNQLAFYTWGDTNCCLPQGATEATLRGAYPHLQPGSVLIFEEKVGPQTGDPADADLRHRCAVRLTGVATRDSSGNPLVDLLFAANGAALVSATQTPVAVTEIEWSLDDALPFPLCLSSTYFDANGDPHSLSGVSTAAGNVVLADHGLTFKNIPIGTVTPPLVNAPPAATDRCNPVAATAQPVRFRPPIPNSPLTQAVPLSTVPIAGTAGVTPSLTLSAADLMQVAPADALPSITLTSSGELSATWLPQQDLLENGESDTVFVVEVESDGTATLRFGDNTNGRAPVTGAIFTANYRIGNGSAGNVGAESLIFLAANPSIQSCTNPMPAIGGTDPETADQIRRRAPQAFLTQDRAVTPSDYEDIVERNVGVDQAVADLRWTGSWYTVFVAAEPVGGGNLSPALKTTLASSLEQFRLVGQDIELESPHYVSIEIELQVTVDPSYFQLDVEQSLLAVLGNKILPNGQKGLFYPDNFTFGQTVYLSPVYAAARSVAGVVSVFATKFQSQGYDTSFYRDAGAIRLGSLQIARLENDPSYPDHGTLTLIMEGGK
jgi:hypothetical protein